MNQAHTLASASLAGTIARRVGLADGVSGLAGVLDQDEDLASLVGAVRARYGSAVCTVLLYGSYTRGERDTLIDLYVLTQGQVPRAALPTWQRLANRCLAPNVYQLQGETGARCKYALLPLADFQRHLRHDFHSYFWARFAQPCQVLYAADQTVAQALTDGFGHAVRRMLSEARRGLAAPIAAQTLWEHALAQTYRCELRAESGKRPAQLVARYEDYLMELLCAWRDEKEGGQAFAASGEVIPASGGWRWPVRRAWGKALSVARLLKAGATFNDGFDYLLWKIERHSGIYVEPTARQRRWPLLFAWPLFWRLYRLGAFR